MTRKWAQITMHWTVQKKQTKRTILKNICKQAGFRVATHGSSNFYGIDTCSTTSIGVPVSSDNTFNLLLIYFNY